MKRDSWACVPTFDGLTLDEIHILTAPHCYFVEVVRAVRERTGLDLCSALGVAQAFAAKNCMPRVADEAYVLTDHALDELTR